MKEPSPSELDAIAREAWAIELPVQRRGLLRDQAAKHVDGLLSRCARGRGALDVAIGEGLLALCIGDRLMRLGYAGIGDYSREQLGMAGSTAQKLARFTRGLRDRPFLRDAVWTGRLTSRKAETILRAARGEDEEAWVTRAVGGATVRALKAEVKAATGVEPEEEEAWEGISFPLSQEARPAVRKALDLAGKILGATAPRWERVEAMCQDYLGAHSHDEEPARSGVLSGPVPDVDALMESLEQQSAQWAFLDEIDSFLAPVQAASVETAPLLLDAELRRLAALRLTWDDVFGHLAMIFSAHGFWRDAGFASFGHYCSERLGMAERTVEQRIALERRLLVLPALRRAMRGGRVSYEKARVIAWQADDTTIEGLIEVAQGMTCIELRRLFEAKEERQMCARGDFNFRAPRGIASLLSVAFAAAREQAGKWLTPSECFQRIAEHFIETWEPLVRVRKTRQRRILARDGGFCRVPICSRAAGQDHHVEFLSAGGSNDDWNQVAACPPHHLRGVHAGYIRVTGRAPDELIWEIVETGVRLRNRLNADWSAPSGLAPGTQPAAPGQQPAGAPASPHQRRDSN